MSFYLKHYQNIDIPNSTINYKIVCVYSNIEMNYCENRIKSPEQFLSDVGGAAGLVLGMSLATLIGAADCLFVSTYRYLCGLRKRRTLSRGMPSQASSTSRKTGNFKIRFDGRNSYDHAMDLKNNPDVFPDLFRSIKNFK